MGSVTPKLAVVFLVPLAMACGAAERDGEQKPLERARVASTRGSAVVLSRDERVAVVTNRSAGVVTVFHLDPEKPLEHLVQTSTEIDRGPGSEAWAAVIGADDDTAYVISRRDQEVFRILELHDNPHLDPGPAVRVGSEPTAIAIQPSGTRIFVANWGEGTISVITTHDFVSRQPLDLNLPLAQAVPLGGISPRPALAHPRALAITDNGDGDDSDETLYATEFFSQPMETSDSADDLHQFDRNRQGIIYPVRFSEGQVGIPIAIAPVLETGFVDSNDAMTACFPNQLYAAAADGGQLFVTSMCVSPVGPLGAVNNTDGTVNTANFKTLFHPVVFVIDTTTNEELPDQRLVVTRKLEELYTQDDASQRRMPLIPNDIAFVAGTADQPRKACITAMGANAVFCVHYDDRGFPLDIGSSGARFIGLDDDDGLLHGRLPVGLAASQRTASQYALVANDNTGIMSVVDTSSNTVKAVSPVIAEASPAHGILESTPNIGRESFATGLEVWSFKGQAWGSCEGCHPDGLSDGVTWFFARGPRRTLSTAGTYDAEGRRRVLLWTASIDEVHDVEIIVRTVVGGAGAMLWNYPAQEPSNDLRILYDGSPVPAGQDQAFGPKPSTRLLNNLSGSLEELVNGSSCLPTDFQCDGTALSHWDDIDAYIRSVRTPRAPTQLEPVRVLAGQRLFDEGGCAACHAGPQWTLSRVFYTPGEKNNGSLPYGKPPALDPALLGELRTATYDVPPELLPLNPPAQATGRATLRRWEPGTQSALDYAYDKATYTNDQINCVLRAVGTFGISASGAVRVAELRSNMTDLALGQTGFNIPSLLGLATGAPYFHAGNARTLEESLDQVFQGHHQAIKPSFLAPDAPNRTDDVRLLVEYLLSIDETTPSPAADPGFDFCAGVSGLE